MVERIKGEKGAALLLTTEAMVAEKPKEREEMPPMPPGGGIGGMGGMM